MVRGGGSSKGAAARGSLESFDPLHVRKKSCKKSHLPRSPSSTTWRAYEQTHSCSFTSSDFHQRICRRTVQPAGPAGDLTWTAHHLPHRLGLLARHLRFHHPRSRIEVRKSHYHRRRTAPGSAQRAT